MPPGLWLGAFALAQVLGWVDLATQALETVTGRRDRDSAAEAALEARRAQRAAKRAGRHASSKLSGAASAEAANARRAAQESQRAAGAAASARGKEAAERAACSATHWANEAEEAEAAAAAAKAGGAAAEGRAPMPLVRQLSVAAPFLVVGLALAAVARGLRARVQPKASHAVAAPPLAGSNHRAPDAVDEVVALLLKKRTRAEEARLAALILLLSQSQPPKGSSGPSPQDASLWEVVWSQQPLFWRGLWGGNPDQSAQRFCTSTGELSSATDLGFLRLTAKGRFTPKDDSGAWGDKPVFTAQVEGGELELGGFRLPLWLAGSCGSWTVVYADTRLRVFRSAEAGLAAQMPADLLRRHDSAAASREHSG